MEQSKFWILPDDIAVESLSHCDKRLAKVIEKIGPIECSYHLDAFSFIVEEIVGQMLSNKVADVISQRLYDKCGGSITPESIERLSISDLRGIGLSNAKSGYILSFAASVKNEEIDLNQLKLQSDAEVMKKLMKLRGIGSWTSKMFLLFVLNRPDILPYEDGAFQQAFAWLYEYDEKPTKSIIETQCQIWHPYASTAARYLYRALDMGLTKTDIKSFLR